MGEAYRTIAKYLREFITRALLLTLNILLMARLENIYVFIIY